PTGLLSNLPGSPSDVFRSDDGGATWNLLPTGLKANFPGGGDSDISLDPQTGALAETDLWLGSATVSKSTDKGQTWTPNPLQGIVVQDRQWVAQAGGGVVYHLTHQIPAGLIVSKSIDGGVTYPISTVGATPVDQTGCVCPPGTLIAEGGGGLAGTSDKVGFVYATSTGGVKFARSTNGGLTFTNVDVGPASSDDTEQAFPVVSNAGGNKLAAVWLANNGNSSVVKLSTSSDWGATWSAPRTIVSGGASVYPWVAAQGSKIAVSVYHTTASGTSGTVPESAQWFESYLESTDGGSTFSALETVDPTVVKSGPICTEGTGCSGDRELLDFQSDTIDNAGKANLTWTRSLDGVSDTELRFAKQP
ncbi:MAG: sialidase family protein, partial [Thermoleophilaceae bacterium]